MDDVVDEYECKVRSINCLSNALRMCSLCHVVDTLYNAGVGTSCDWQVSYEVESESLPVAFGYQQWL
jgi:hypothetical protein